MSLSSPHVTHRPASGQGLAVPWAASSLLVAAWGGLGAAGAVYTPVAPWMLLMATPFIAAIGCVIEMKTRRGQALTQSQPVAVPKLDLSHYASAPVSFQAKVPVVSSIVVPAITATVKAAPERPTQTLKTKPLIPAGLPVSGPVSAPQATLSGTPVSAPTQGPIGLAPSPIFFTFEDLSSLSSMLKHAISQHVNTSQVPPLAEDDPALSSRPSSYRVVREGPRYDIRLL